MRRSADPINRVSGFMDQFRELTTKEKALKINLNRQWYGSFAEIGAGQPIAHHFFKAGGASGTIAKTMSAYDMEFSDAIYGKTGRYVCQDRLITMLDHEYVLLPERLSSRADNTCFFALASTVETLNYRKTNQGHGWLGIRFQLRPKSAPNEIILHFMLKDPETIWQQEAIGIIGVNLIYGCYQCAEDLDMFLKNLVQGLSKDRIEVDMCSIHGPDFDWVDNRVLSLKLVKRRMTNAAMFGPDGKVMHASEALYKKNILILRGRFRPLTHVNMDMLRLGTQKFVEEPDVDPEGMLVLSELTLKNLTAEGKIDEQDFLDRVDILCSLGQTVLISSYQEYYRLVAYLSTFNRKRKIGLILGIRNLEQIFDEQYYEGIQGGILQAFGILFGADVKLYVYPALTDDQQEILHLDTFELSEKLQHLFQYLFAAHKIEALETVNSELLRIYSDEVLAMIRRGEEGWEEKVPEQVVRAVKQSNLFGYSKQIVM
ncbi:MAG: TonB-dependent receptor [Bacteroidota bacterium]